MILINQCKLGLIDQPVTQILNHGEYEVVLRFGPSGGVLGFFSVGVVDRFTFGLSTGAANLIGAEDPEIYPHPGIQIKGQILPGGIYLPEWTFGFDNQGFGDYDESRYLIKSKGFYSAVGKNFEFGGGEYYLNGGINYSLENEDKNALDIFLGQKLTLFDQVALLTDYDPGFNDPRCETGGYFNGALRVHLAESVIFEFALRDIFGHGREEQNRIIKLTYQESF